MALHDNVEYHWMHSGIQALAAISVQCFLQLLLLTPATIARLSSKQQLDLYDQGLSFFVGCRPDIYI